MNPRILFVTSPRGLGGSNISLATVLAGLEGRAHRILAGPGHGVWARLVAERNLADERVILSGRRRSARVRNSMRIAWYAYRHRNSLTAIHANATTGLFLSALASRVAGVPVVVWVHDPVTTDFGLRVGPWVRRLVREVTYAAVTEVAAGVAVQYGLCRRSDIVLIPNPISPAEVVPERRDVADRVTIGYLGSETRRKGFDILSKVVVRLQGSGARWRLFTSERQTPESAGPWSTLRSVQGDDGYLEVPGVVSDVRTAYAQCDIVFNPSREESFCRVAAEAMANGIPVVAGDIPALRALLGDDEAGLLYPVEDSEAAATALLRLVRSPELRRRLGEEGRSRAARFQPEPVIEALAELYGSSRSTSA